MVEELEQDTQQDPIPKLPKGYVAIKKGGLPPLPAGYVEKKNLGVNVGQVGGTVGSSKAPSNVPAYTPNTDQSNPFSIGGQYNQPQKLDADNLDLLNTKHDAAIADQIKKYPLRKIPLTPILDNTYRAKPISEIDINEALARNEQHKIDMQTAIDNTTLKVLKQKGIVAGKGSPYYEAERKKIEEKTKPTMIGGIVINGAEATYHKDKDGNIGLDRNLGFLEDMRKSYNAAVDGEDEANAFSGMTTEQKVQYANQKMQENPNPEYMSERTGVGGLIGGAVPYLVKAAAAGTLATAAAIAAPETGGASLVGLAPTLTVLLTAPDMIKQGAKDEIMTRYMQLKQERPNIPDEELMNIAQQGEISGGIVGAAEALAFTTTLKLPILNDSKSVLKTYLKGVASSAVHLGGIMAGTKAAQLAERKLEGYNVDTDKAVDEIATTFTENATAGAILNGLISGAHTLPKVVKSAFKYSLKDTPTSEIKTALDANVEAGRIPPEVAEQTITDIEGYKVALAKTADGLTPETQASVAGLIQARDNVAAEMATKDPTQRAVYEQKIEAYNKQIEKITKTNDPLKYEIDEVTGNPIDKVAPELPDLTVPIEGTDKKGVPVGEDVPAEVKGEPEKITQPIELSTDPSTPQVKSDGVVDKASNVGGDVGVTESGVKEMMNTNNPFSQKVTKALKDLGQVADDFIFGGFVQKDGEGGYWAGDTHFKNDGSIEHTNKEGTTKFDKDGNVISTTVLQGDAKKAKTISDNIEGKKVGLQGLKDIKNSDDFKYKTVTESDPNNPLARRKVKRLKTKEELAESTKKLDEQIQKAEKELADLQNEYNALPEDAKQSLSKQESEGVGSEGVQQKVLSEDGNVSSVFMDKVNDFKKRYQDFTERSAKYIKKDGTFKKAIPESVKEEGAKLAAENQLLRTQMIDGLANLSKDNKEKSRVETEKINADFDARQKELQKEYDLTDEEITQATIDEKLDRNYPLTKDEVSFANENMFAPKGFEFGENGFNKIKTETVNEETKTKIPNPSKKEVIAEPVVSEGVEGEGGGKEPPKEPVKPVGEGKGGEDWTHINKKDITDAEDLASKHPFGESETWKSSVKKGLEKLAKIAKKGESLYDAVKNKVNEWAAKVKQEILDDGKSTFNPSDEEIAQMAYHRTMTNKRIAELEPDLTSPIQAVRDAAEIVLGDLEAQKEMVDYVLHNTATTAGRAFNIRQMVSKIDAENGLQVKRMDVIRKQKGQPLSEKQEQELRDIHDEEVKNQKAKDEYAQKKAEKDFEEAVKLEVDRRMKAKKDKAASDKTSKPPTEKRAKIADKLNEWADKFEKFGRADLPEGTVKSSLAPDVQKMVSNAMRFVAEGVRDGKNIPEILKDAVKKFGENVLEHIKGGLRDIGITDREIEGDRQYALNEIKKLADKEKSDMLTKSAVGKGLVIELVNSHIDNGLTGKDVFTELNKDLKEIFPEITEQQVRDAYLKEGEFTLDKKENINKAKVDAKNELRSIAKNETDIADLKAERDLRKREREERQKTDYENKLLSEKKSLVDKKALTEKQEARLVELNKELDRIKQRKEKDAKVSNPKDLNRSDKEKAVLDEIKKEKEQWAKEKQAQRDLEVAAKKAQTAAKNEADRLKALTEKRDRLQKGQRDAPSTSTPKVESPAIEQVKSEIKEADKKLREAESEANRLNKEMQAKKDKLAEHEANIKRAENGLESIKTNRKKSDRQIDTDIADAETRLKKELNKQGLKLEKGSKAEREQKQKVADNHNERVDKVIESIDTKLQDATLTAPEKAALENAKKILEKSKVNPDSALDIFDAVDKAEKNTELARAELANSDKLAGVKHEISSSQIQMGKDKLQTEQDILLQRHKDNLQKKINENERRLEAGEFVEKEPPRLKTSDAESVRLEIKDRETKNKLNAVGKKAQREAMTKREKVIDTLQSLYVIGLVGRLSTLAKVGVSAITKQPLNTITSQTFGRLGGVLFPKIENALRGEGNEGWRKEKNRYMAHYGALGKEGMAKLISKGKENAQKADEAYINAKGKLEDIANQHGKDSKQYKDFEKGEFKKAEDKQKQALLDNVTNSMYEWIGGNSWADAAEVFLHSSAKLEQLLGKGEREMWSDKTRKEKIMFVLSTSAATHGVLKNFSARAEFAANFVARLENKMKQGIDISSAEEILKTVNESYIAFQRGKYQEDNAITGGFKAGLDGLRIWAEKHPDYKYAADLMAGALKFKNPIVRTPLNIAREAIVEYTIGVPLAIAKYRNSLKDAKVDAKQFDLAGQEMKNHMKKFMDNIPADKADFIYRAFRKGGFGLGVMALTAMGGIQFGGFFNRDEKRRKKGDELGINEVEIGGVKLTHLQAKIFEHTSAFFPALLWSNYDRVRNENLKAGHGEIGANLDAAMKDFQGMMDQIPIGNEIQNPLSGVQIPLIGPFLTEYAEASDVDANGEQIKRTPKGNPLEKIWQNFEMKIPGLRQNVPIRGGGSGWGEQDLKNPSLKALSDAGATKPDYTPDKIATKYINGKPTEKLSDKPKKVQDDYITKHTENYKLEADKLVNGVYKVYKNKDGGVHIKGNNTNEKGTTYTPFKDLDADQKKYLEGQITRKATVKTKKALKFELDETEKTEDQ